DSAEQHAGIGVESARVAKVCFEPHLTAHGARGVHAVNSRRKQHESCDDECPHLRFGSHTWNSFRNEAANPSDASDRRSGSPRTNCRTRACVLALNSAGVPTVISDPW